MDLESERVYYIHDADCSEDNFVRLDNGLKKCLDCSGVFTQEGKGVAVTDKRFD